MEKKEYYILSRDSREGETALPKFDFHRSSVFGRSLLTHQEALQEVAVLESMGYSCAVVPKDALERVLKE